MFELHMNGQDQNSKTSKDSSLIITAWKQSENGEGKNCQQMKDNSGI